MSIAISMYIKSLSKFDILASTLLLASFLFIAPLRYDGDQIFALIACMVLASLASFYPAKRHVDTRIPATFFVFATAVGLWEFAWFKVYALVVLFIGLAALKTFAERTAGNFRFYGWVLLATACVVNAHLWMQLNGWDPVWAVTFRDQGAMFGKPWALGSFAAMSVPFLYAVHPVAPILVTPLLWFSHSSLCVAAGLLGWWLCMGRTWRWITVCLVPIGALYYLGHDGGPENHRVEIWKNTWHFVVERPWFGRGYGSWEHSGFVRFINGEGVAQPWAHNEFYQILYELGVVGAVLLVGWVLWLFVKIERFLKAALVVTCACAFFHPIMHWGRLVLFPILILGLCLADAMKKCRGARCLLAPTDPSTSATPGTEPDSRT